jgi:transposase
VSEFSGILCVDEVYQGQLALLVAVDPAAPLGDRLIGYQLVQEPVDSGIVEAFLQRLAGMGLRPDQVVTDGSTLYPRVLARVWPQAAHQLCLFHETRRLTRAAMAVISQVRKTVPPAPQPPPAHLGWSGPLRAVPPSDDPHDPAVQRWHLRRQRRAEGIALVQALAARGLSARAICRQTGLARHTVRRWLTSVPDAPSLRPDPAPALSAHARPRRQRQTPALLAQIHALAAAGLTHVAIAQRTGVHRVTVSTWLKHALPDDGVHEEAPTTAVARTRDDQRVLPDPATAADPPPPWRDWEEVRQVREALKEHRFLLLRQPKTLTDVQAEQVALLLHSPVGAALGVARRFLLDWWLIWRDAEGTKRTLPEAQAGYQLWQTDPAFAAVPALARVQSQVTQTQFTRLSQFLRHPQWEATNNGAERAGRAFRHRQQPHFNLRGVASIEGSLRLVCQQQCQSVLAPPPPGARSARGRPIKGLPRAA